MRKCWEVIDRLVKEIDILKERLNTTFKNSSQPPFRNKVKVKPRSMLLDVFATVPFLT